MKFIFAWCMVICAVVAFWGAFKVESAPHFTPKTKAVLTTVCLAIGAFDLYVAAILGAFVR